MAGAMGVTEALNMSGVGEMDETTGSTADQAAPAAPAQSHARDARDARDARAAFWSLNPGGTYAECKLWLQAIAWARGEKPEAPAGAQQADHDVKRTRAEQEPVRPEKAVAVAREAHGYIRDGISAWDRENLRDCIETLAQLAAVPGVAAAPDGWQIADSQSHAGWLEVRNPLGSFVRVGPKDSQARTATGFMLYELGATLLRREPASQVVHPQHDLAMLRNAQRYQQLRLKVRLDEDQETLRVSGLRLSPGSGLPEMLDAGLDAEATADMVQGKSARRA